MSKILRFASKDSCCVNGCLPEPHAMPFLAWLLIAWGFTLIVTVSKLFKPLRDRANRMGPKLDDHGTWAGALMRCPMCFGFWAGAMLSVAGLVGPAMLVCPSWWLPFRAWADGCAAAGACWIVHVVLVRLGANDL